eukprot:gene33418-41234_t
MIEIEFRNVGKSFIDRQTSQPRSAVTNVNISIRSGEEIVVDLPHRNDPLARRKLPEIGPLAGRLMELLKVGKDQEAELH